MRSKIFLFLFSATLLLTASCKKATDSTRLVPKDAFMVMHIDASSLSSKLSWKEIQESPWFKKMYAGEKDSLAKKMMDNPENSGMDLGKDMTMFLKKQGQGTYMSFQGTLKSASDFEKFNLDMDRNAKVTEEGDLHMMRIAGMAVVWKKDHFMYLNDVPMGANSAYYGRPAYSFPVDSLFQIARDLYSMDDENSLSKDAKFSSMLKEKGDLHLWVNSEALYNGMSDQMGMLSMMKMEEIMKGSVASATVNFDNGKITMTGKQYSNPKMAELYKKYSTRKVSGELLNRVPSANVAGIIALSYPPETIKEIITLLGMDGMLNGVLGKMGYSMDELVKAQGGDMLIVASDIDMGPATMPSSFSPQDKNDQYQYKIEEPTDHGYVEPRQAKQNVKILFATSVGDKTAFDKLVDIIKLQAASLASGLPPIFSHSDGKWFAAGNDSTQVHSFIKGEGVKQPFASKLTGHPFGMYIDLQKIFTAMDAVASSPLQKQKLSIVKNTWVDILVYGGEFKDDYMESYGEINFTDKSTNSLKQLNRFIDQISEEKAVIN